MKKGKIIIAILFLCVITLTGCSNSEEDINEKISQELDYLDTQIVSILNKLNNITLQNYNISSEEVSLGQKDENSSGGISKNEMR